MSLYGEERDEYLTTAEVAAEMLKMATRLTNLANELLQGKPRHVAKADQAPLTLLRDPQDDDPVERSVGVHGAVTEDVALMRASELQEFSTLQFAESCGIQPPAAMHWLAVLMAQKPPVLVREGITYKCLKKPVLTSAVMDWCSKQAKAFSRTAMMRECSLEGWQADEALRALMQRGTLRKVELNGYDLFESPLVDVRRLGPDIEVKRGEPVRDTGSQMDRRQRSLNKHQLEQRKNRRAAMDNARDQRAAEQSAKAKASPQPNRRRK